MREIKFRAWQPQSKKMVYDGVVFNQAGSLVVDEWLMQDFELVWMQGTGLVDKNKSELYEFDIVMFPDGSYAIIEWDKGKAGFVFRLIGSNQECSAPFAIKHTYKIGNKLEHHHLLSKEPNVQASVATEDDSSNEADKQNQTP